MAHASGLATTAASGLDGVGRPVMVLMRRGARVVIMVDGGAVRVQVEMGVAVDVGVAVQGRWEEPALRQPNGAGGQSLQEAPVVGDDDHGLIEAGQVPDQALLGRLVEPVGGLVEQEHGRLHGQHGGERDQPFLPGGEPMGDPLGEPVEAQHRQGPLRRGARPGRAFGPG